MEKFWLGLLMVIFLLKKDSLVINVFVGLFIVGVCMLEYFVSLVLIDVVNIFVVVLSVNCLGKLSLMMVSYVIEDLDGKIVGIIDGGVIGVGLEFIVIDCFLDILVILCLGGVIKE